jgi:hypothetical protein
MILLFDQRGSQESIRFLCQTFSNPNGKYISYEIQEIFLYGRFQDFAFRDIANSLDTTVQLHVLPRGTNYLNLTLNAPGKTDKTVDRPVYLDLG